MTALLGISITNFLSEYLSVIHLSEAEVTLQVQMSRCQVSESVRSYTRLLYFRIYGYPILFLERFCSRLRQRLVSSAEHWASISSAWREKTLWMLLCMATFITFSGKRAQFPRCNDDHTR